MSTTQPLDEGPLDELDAQLVAYLDGELEAEQRFALEERLMEDSDCKNRLRLLQQSFDMLGELPSTRLDGDFAQTTVEMIALSASQELAVVQKRKPWKYGAALAGVALASVVLFALGMLYVSQQQNQQRRQEFETLAVAENLRAYLSLKSVDDIDFFVKLSQEPSWQESISVYRELGELPSRTVERRLAALPISEMEKHVESMAPDLRRDLRLQNQQLMEQPAERQAALRDFKDRIEQREDSALLMETIVAYVDWMDSLRQSQKKEIQSASSSARLARVLERLQNGSRSQKYLANIERIYAMAFEVAKPRVGELREALKENELADLLTRIQRAASETGFKKGDALTHFLTKAWVMPALQGVSFQQYHWAASLTPLNQEESEEIRMVIDETEQQLALQISEPRDRARVPFFVLGSILRRSPIQSSGSTDAAETYLATDEGRRERYDLQEPKETLKELRGGGSWPGRGGRGGRGGPMGRSGLGGDRPRPDSLFDEGKHPARKLPSSDKGKGRGTPR